MLLLFLLLSLTRARTVLSHLLGEGGAACTTRDDCLAARNNSWCASGVHCHRGRCATIADYPCRRTQLCDEEARACLPRTCSRSTDCDDGLFCNGVEHCVMEPRATVGHCVADHATGCAFGICNEATRSCVTPQRVAEARASHQARLVVLQTNEERAARNELPRSARHDAATTPTAAPTSPGEWWLPWWAILLILLAGLLVLALLLFLVAQGGARHSPTYIITGTANGADQYTTEMDY